MKNRIEYVTNEVPADEPIFILRAQDAIAPMFIEQWANAAQALGTPEKKVAEARMIAQQMKDWPIRKIPD